MLWYLEFLFFAFLLSLHQMVQIFEICGETNIPFKRTRYLHEKYEQPSLIAVELLLIEF